MFVIISHRFCKSCNISGNKRIGSDLLARFLDTFFLYEMVDTTDIDFYCIFLGFTKWYIICKRIRDLSLVTILWIGYPKYLIYLNKLSLFIFSIFISYWIIWFLILLPSVQMNQNLSDIVSVESSARIKIIVTVLIVTAVVGTVLIEWVLYLQKVSILGW